MLMNNDISDIVHEDKYTPSRDIFGIIYIHIFISIFINKSGINNTEIGSLHALFNFCIHVRNHSNALF